MGAQLNEEQAASNTRLLYLRIAKEPDSSAGCHQAACFLEHGGKLSKRIAHLALRSQICPTLYVCAHTPHLCTHSLETQTHILGMFETCFLPRLHAHAKQTLVAKAAHTSDCALHIVFVIKMRWQMWRTYFRMLVHRLAHSLARLAAMLLTSVRTYYMHIRTYL